MSAFDKLAERVKDNQTTVAAVAGAGVVVAGAALLYRQHLNKVPIEGPYKGNLPADAFDAVIVGAGPSGSTTAFYAAKEGAKIALLDKATFPRGAFEFALSSGV